MVPDHYRDLSNEVLYDVLSQGASKLPEVKYLDMCNLLHKRDFFWNLLLRPLVILMLLLVKHHTVPHLKGLTTSGLEPIMGHGRSSTFILQHTILKSTQFAS